MSTGALLLARISDPETFLPVARVLEHSGSVECWNAVDGHINLVAKLRVPSAELTAQIKDLHGVDSLDVFGIADESGTTACDPSLCHSFVFLEVSPEKLASVRSQLTSLQAVSFTATGQAGTTIIGIVSGNSFQSIDRTIDEHIRPIDGVLRLKQDRVINLKRL